LEGAEEEEYDGDNKHALLMLCCCCCYGAELSIILDVEVEYLNESIPEE
jgi:hypothetical protein